jgi:aspartyl-tRNA(Asn)/glutamyl-tRNA(Gln) amidotransferase subunit B
VVRWNDIGYADLEKGQMRVDVNISTKQTDSQILGTRVEIKNINSFAAIRKAIQYEFQRQSALLSSGKSVDQETVRWDDPSGTTMTMRSKEQAHDYRYFSENDLPLLNPTSIERDKKFETISGYDIITQFLGFGFQKEYIHGLLNNELLYNWFQHALKQAYEPKFIAKRLL